MEPLLAAVTYTKDGHKKRKNQKWLDGMLRYNPETHAGVLLTEDGQSICQGKVPKEFLPGGEEFPLEQHILVSIDEWRTGAPPGATPAPPQAASLLHSLTTATASRPAQRSKTFAVPQPMPLARQAPNPAQYSSNCGEVPLSNSMRHRNLGAVRPCDPMPTLAQPVQRSTDEILELLGICVPLSMRAIAGDTADPAGHPEATCPAAAPSMPEAGSSAPGAPGSSKWGGTSQQGLTTSAPSLEGRSKDTPASSEIPKQHPCTEVRRIGNGPPSGHGMQWRAPAAPGQLSRAPMSLHAAPSHVGSVPVGLTNSRAQPAPPAKRIPGSIYFPGPQDKVLRGVAVPERFNSGASYQQSWEAALCEEITLRIADCAKNFHAACGATNGPRGAAAAGRDGSALETALRKARVPYYGSCELFIWQNYPARKGGAPAGGHKKRKKGQGSDDEEDGEEPTKPENVYLILKSGRQKSAEYHKGDMWIISNVPLLQSGLDAGVPGDRNRAPWTAVVCSLWHGPNQDGKFEVEFLSPRPPSLGRKLPVYALKGPEASMELSLLDLLRSGTLSTLPILPHLLAPARTQPPPAQPSDSADTGPSTDSGGSPPLTPAQRAQQVISEFNLNEEQAAVLRHVASWGGPSPAAPSPVCLVHGPFGTGKSSLLVALLHLIVSFSDAGIECPLSSARVLVSAHTNVAVDRVMLGLMESGFSDFLRVGPLRRIDSRLLAHSLHASESRTNATAAAELRDMLKEASGNPAEEAVLRAELAAAERGAERQRKKLLKTARVVGVTCCSSLLPALDGLSFDVVVLDECSQMIEPLSLAPMLRAKCKFLVGAGDPQQLPPVVASPPAPPSGHGLARPMFVRLAELGATPYLLRRQYRCHPAISAIPNAHFYGARLLDGCSPEQRASLLSGLPPVIFIDVRGTEQRNGRSVRNPEEARAVAAVVQRALGEGVPASKVGVICFYRAQVGEIRAQLQSLSGVSCVPAQGTAREPPSTGERGKDTKGRGVDDDEDLILGEDSSLASVQVATVDAFQGAEKDLIVLTTAITRPGTFAADACRLNVALTRARCNLVVVGCAQALERTAPAFAALLKTARSTPGGYSGGGQLPPAAIAGLASET